RTRAGPYAPPRGHRWRRRRRGRCRAWRAARGAFGPRVLRGLVRVLAQLLGCQPQAGDRRLEQPSVHVEEYALIQRVGQQAERRMDLVGGGFQIQPPLEPDAALAPLAPLELNRRLLVPAIGAAASLRFRPAILALSGHGSESAARCVGARVTTTREAVRSIV